MPARRGEDDQVAEHFLQHGQLRHRRGGRLGHRLDERRIRVPQRGQELQPGCRFVVLRPPQPAVGAPADDIERAPVRRDATQEGGRPLPSEALQQLEGKQRDS
jgi:hypothetical protein